MNKPIMAYLAFSFSGSVHGMGLPKSNTERARRLALAIMEEKPEWCVLVPHYAIDAMLDGTNKWAKGTKFSEDRRKLGGIMSLNFLSNSDILILGCDPVYKISHGVTWEYVFANLLNESWRAKNPIEIIYAKDIIGENKYIKIMELK
jgi:hypothetical protein